LGKKPSAVEITDDSFIDEVGESLVAKLGNLQCYLFDRAPKGTSVGNGSDDV